MASIVKEYIIFNCFNEHFSARELFKIVHLGFQDPPLALHRSIIKASSDTRHTLNHARINEFLVKHLVCVLKSSVAMKDRFCIHALRSKGGPDDAP